MICVASEVPMERSSRPPQITEHDGLQCENSSSGRPRWIARGRKRSCRGARLALAAVCAVACVSGVGGQWPVCYDYMMDVSACPTRTASGDESTDGTFEPVCFHTNFWQENYPPPDCRNEGCRKDRNSPCCCGADQDVPGAKDPTKEECLLAEFGDIRTTGGAMNRCDECKQGRGGNDGAGGTVNAVYGFPELAATGTPDPATYGHVSQYEYKLKACSSIEIGRFIKWETEVNRECDVKTFLKMRKCGNCYRAICQFHNALHWEGSDGDFTCSADLFVRRMNCYRDWYFKYCDCSVTIPTNDIAGDAWRESEECSKTQPLFGDIETINGVSGIRRICSSTAGRPSVPPSLELFLAAAAALLCAVIRPR
uniref:Uncharacterized protein n=1 Tax=Hemiselmis tepida TaxID=464990 RepID=A0A7S0Z0T1_9CRYP